MGPELYISCVGISEGMETDDISDSYDIDTV